MWIRNLSLTSKLIMIYPGTRSHGSVQFPKVGCTSLAAPATTDVCLVEIEGVVEFKSLPSGLHNVKEDIVYGRNPPSMLEA